MKLINTLVICLCLNFGLNAQNVQVLDQDTQIPVVGVTIYNANKDKSVITDIEGKASLDQFNTDETLYFQSYTLRLIFD